MAEASPLYPLALISTANFDPASIRRTASITFAPCFTSVSEMMDPKDPVAPVTIAVFPVRSLSSNA